jgi:hypothetical protein
MMGNNVSGNVAELDREFREQGEVTHLGQLRSVECGEVLYWQGDPSGSPCPPIGVVSKRSPNPVMRGLPSLMAS